jgi:hypothetical protein
MRFYGITQCFSNCRPQAVSDAKALQKLYQTLNDRKIRPYMLVIKLPLYIDLLQKVGEIVLPITSCPSIINLENALIQCLENMWLW